MITGLLVVVILLLGALIAVGPILAVREERRLAAEERGWLQAGRFPAQVERVYRHPRLILTDGSRLRLLGYELVERRVARGPWARVLVAVWRAAGPPAGSGDRGADSVPGPPTAGGEPRPDSG